MITETLVIKIYYYLPSLTLVPII